jgi:ABC-type polysaccharide/polyol phosphate transport system ATPase subunit
MSLLLTSQPPAMTPRRPTSHHARRRTPRMPVVECRDLVKHFYRYQHRTRTMREFFIRTVLQRPIHVRHAEFALEDFNLSVQRGESVALVGSNGSGKSTVLRLIAGIYTPTRGTVTIRGQVSAIVDLGVGFHPELTGLENITQYAAICGLSQRQARSRVDAIVHFAGIGDFVSEPVKYYSSGMLARLAFATATHCVDPDILLIDEVLAVGDHEFQQRCIQYLHDFRSSGGTLLLVSHGDELLRELCDRGIWVERGRVRMQASIDEVLQTYAAASTVRETVQPH